MVMRFNSPLVYMRESYSIRCKMLFLVFVVKYINKKDIKKEIWLHFNCGICFYMYTGIIPFSDCGDFVASLVSGVVSFMAEGRVGSVKG